MALELLGYVIAFLLGVIFIIVFMFSKAKKKPRAYFFEFAKLLKPPSPKRFKSSLEFFRLSNKGGLELLEIPSLEEAEKGIIVPKQAKPELSLPNKVVLFTGDNLSGYHELLLETLFSLPSLPVFLVARERDLDRFEDQKNIILSVYSPERGLGQELKELRFKFYKREISEEEYRSRLSELKTKLEKEEKFVKPGEKKSAYRNIFSPADIIGDVKEFRKHVPGNGLIVVSVLEDILSQETESAFRFLEQLINVCTRNSLPLFLTLEEGVFDLRTVKRVKFYCDIVFETSFKKGKKVVNIFTPTKILSEQKLDSVSINIGRLWQEISAGLSYHSVS